ncbi:uncharacterized protein LOC142225281 [Haematobia irritans]|uniref:uncharacterized protein LOC142225281 n=1 Tax=Haematobia irritans TaxID=7368 RepID=UPI003F50C246
MSEYRSQIRKTGGGQAPLGAPLQGNDIAILLPNEFVLDENEFDSDITFSKNDDTLDENTFLEVEMLSDIEEEVKEEIKLNSDTLKTVKSLKKKKPSAEKSSVAENNIIKIVTTEVECQMELHKLQVEVEKKKLRNLDLEYDILQAKLNFYTKRTVGKHFVRKRSLEFEVSIKFEFSG